MMEITWHLDPTVAERAVLGCHVAEVWDAPPGWAVFHVHATNPAAQGRPATDEAAKAEAEAALRRLEPS